MINVTNDNFKEEVLDSGIPTVVDFYADWCGPCKAMAPILDSLSKEDSTIKYVKVNTDEQVEISAKYGVRNLPTIIIIKNGDVVGKQIGAISISGMRDKIRASIQ